MTMDGNSYAIQISKLSKKFGSLTAVDDVTLDVKSGELFALLGPNGAGKTTLIKILCGLLVPTDGTATIMGHDVRREMASIEPIINISPQETAIAGKLTALENLELGGGVYGLPKKDVKKHAEDLLALMGLKDRAGDKVQYFSGGMQRRLSIAMALMSDPQILFLDEPTLGLDPQARRELWGEIEKLKGQKTIILTTHYLEEADALADHIAIIKEGKIAAAGMGSELKKQFAAIQTMVVTAKNINDQAIKKLEAMQLHVKATDDKLTIEAKEIDFNKVIDSLRQNGITITWLSMLEPSLDDTYLKIVGKEK